LIENHIEYNDFFLIVRRTGKEPMTPKL